MPSGEALRPSAGPPVWATPGCRISPRLGALLRLPRPPCLGLTAEHQFPHPAPDPRCATSTPAHLRPILLPRLPLPTARTPRCSSEIHGCAELPLPSSPPVRQWTPVPLPPKSIRASSLLLLPPTPPSPGTYLPRGTVFQLPLWLQRADEGILSKYGKGKTMETVNTSGVWGGGRTKR